MRNIALSFFFFSLFLPAVARMDARREGVLQAAVAGKKAQVGMAVIVDGVDTATVNNAVRYPMMSVFKFHQALAVADYLERTRKSLETLIYIPAASLRPNTHSPLRDRYPHGDIRLSIGDLLVYTLQQSDNNACDILFEHTVGVAESDAYIRSLGMEDFSMVATEDDMHRDARLCYENWTTPLEAARLMDVFLTHPKFSAACGSFIRNTLTACKTGQERLAKPLAGEEVVLGHKTGTGDRDARGRWMGINDVGFVLLPDGRRYTIAVLVRDSEESFSDTEKIIADISGLVYDYVSRSW